jgi:hypothetical protein
VNAQILLAFLLVPSERTNAREQLPNCAVFRHSEVPRRSGCDTTCTDWVRFDGFEALPRPSSHKDVYFDRTFGEMYIQMYSPESIFGTILEDL